MTGFEPVSEAGRAGIEELESQTGQLLSFQGVGQPVFDTQVAFNMLDRFGPGEFAQIERGHVSGCVPRRAHACRKSRPCRQYK